MPFGYAPSEKDYTHKPLVVVQRFRCGSAQSGAAYGGFAYNENRRRVVLSSAAGFVRLYRGSIDGACGSACYKKDGKD